MESSQQLLGDSYSYRWLIATLNDSSRSTAAVAFSFIELDPTFISKRFASDSDSDGEDDNITDFNFVLPDEVFSSGIARLLPLESKTAADELRKLRTSSASSSPPVFRTARSSPASWASACSPLPGDRDSRRGEIFASSGFRSAPKKILRKYLRFLLMPLFKKVKELRPSSKNPVRTCKDSSASSPRSSNALGSIEWCRSNADISISDAILHCKKSNGFRQQLED